MRTLRLIPTALLLSLTNALQLPDLQPFIQALPNALQHLLPELLQDNNSTAHDDLRKRQDSNACPTDFNSCANLGAQNLCCHTNAVCSADYAGHVACCPSGAACTGTIGGVITSGTLDSNGGLVGGGAAAATSMSNGGLAGQTYTTTTSFQFASSTTSNNGLVVAGTQTPAASENGQVTNGGGFIVDGTSTVATPGAGVRRAEVPFVAQAIIRVLELLPI